MQACHFLVVGIFLVGNRIGQDADAILAQGRFQCVAHEEPHLEQLDWQQLPERAASAWGSQKKAKELRTSPGLLIVIGLAKPVGIADLDTWGLLRERSSSSCSAREARLAWRPAA